MANGLLSPNPLDDPNYDYGTILPFRQRNMLDVDELATDVAPEFAVPSLLRDVGNAAVRMGQMARGERAPGLLIGDVMDFSPAGLLGRMPTGALGMNAFHGTPNRWEPEAGFPQGRPRLDKMGTGEGAQAYGRGFYSAESGGVGAQYRGALSYKDTVQKFRDELPDDADFEDVTDLLGTGLFSADQEAVIRALRDDDWLGFDYPSQAISAAYSRDLDNFDPSPALKEAVQATGTLYKLDIPDADAAKLLDYDAPISAQPKVVQDAITKLGFMPDTPDKLAGGDVWFRMRQQLGEQEAADAMREAGVPGLRYKDAGSRGKGDSDGTRNFVVWDQDVLDRTKVLQRNDETFEATPGVPVMGLLNKDDRPGGTNLLGLYTGGAI